MKKEEMKKSTKILTWVFGALAAVLILGGLALGVGTMGSGETSETFDQGYTQTEDMF